MNKLRNLIIAILIAFLSACASKHEKNIKPETSSKKIIENPVRSDDALAAPELFKQKSGKTLKLVRMMEGGACKNKLQGVIGTFKLYANTDDVDRIKANQGAGVFADFEAVINQFSMQTLQQTVNNLNFPEGSADKISTNQRKLSTEFSNEFVNLIADDISQFEADTALTIDIIPLTDSLFIKLNGCDLEQDY